MPKYVALLRGINVGAKTKVEMPRLKAVFEALGCEGVSTYINSGNVLFSDNRSAKQLNPLIEAAIAKEFKLNISVIIRDQANIQMLAEKIPKGWNNTNQRTEVMFLWDEVDGKSAIQHFKINQNVENLIYLPGALVWNISREHYKQGSGPKLIKAGFYKKMTGRNVNTVRKLFDLMSA